MGTPGPQVHESLLSPLAPERSRPGLLVPLRAGGVGRPLFLVHASGGTALPYLPLVRQLGDYQRCFGIEAVGINGEPPLRSVPEMAGRYVEAIRQACPRGPYYLAGWSMGGALAFEVATTLRARREQVALLALIDSVPRTSLRDPPDRAGVLALFAQSLARAVGLPGLPVAAEDLRGLPPGEQELRVLGELARAGAAPPGTEPIVRARIEVFSALLAALAAWRPQHYDGRVDLLFTGERSASERARGWAALTSGPTVALRVPGDHYTMMRAPHVQELARVLQQQIRAATGAPWPADDVAGRRPPGWELA